MKHKKVNKLNSNNKSNSSKKWLMRQLNDPYVHKAKEEGYRCRAAYKLLDINEKFGILKVGHNVIDLGAAPGGWSQVLARLLNSDESAVDDNGVREFNAIKPIAIDLLPMDPIPGVHFIQKDFFDLVNEDFDTITSLASDLNMMESYDNKRIFDVVLSDMAPNTIGHAITDHLRIMHLCENVCSFAFEWLKPGGSLVMKIFQGGAQTDLLSLIKKKFAIVKHYKPDSSRKDSSEMYLIAMGFRL